MRRYILLILLALIVVVPFLMRWGLQATQAKPADMPAGAPRLVIVTPHNQDIRREFARAFSQWHQSKYGSPVQLDFRMPGGTNDIKRLLETTYRAWRDDKGNIREDMVADIDVVWGGGDFFFDIELKPAGILQPIPLDPQLLKEAFPQPTLAGVKLIDIAKDKDGNLLPPKWVGVCLSSFGIVYNPDVFHSLELPEPKRWDDLADPKLSGWIALADPTHSGSVAVAYMMVIQRAMADAEAELFHQQPELKNLPKDQRVANADYQAAIARGWKQGMGLLLRIAANARYFGDAASTVPNDVGNGEAAAGMVIDFYGRVYQEAVGDFRCKFIAPAAATAVTPDPVAILYGVKGERLTTATRFVEFLLTPQGQRLWILKPGTPDGPHERSLRRPPVRPELYADRTDWADDANPFAEAGDFNQRNEWMTLFSDTRPLWAAAWIDSREALKSAYARILAVPDPSHRNQLLTELAALPIEMSDVENLRKERKRIETAHGNAEEFKAQQRIEWAKRFRAHYASVASKAER